MKIVVVPPACSDVSVVTSQRIVCYRAVHGSPHLLKMAQVKEVFCFFSGGWGGFADRTVQTIARKYCEGGFCIKWDF